MSLSIAAYRARYEHAHRPKLYSGLLHAAVIAIFVGSSVGSILFRYAGLATPLDWAALPLTILTASYVEYWAHRVPMHRPIPGLRAVYERHSRRHHRFFVADVMQFRSTYDFHAVLFPPVLLLFFAAIAVSCGIAIALITTEQAGALFVATALAYYLAYELLHLAYHSFDHPACPKWRWLNYLAQHHRRHHEPRRMRQGNFNLVLPLFDVAFGTLLKSNVHAGVGLAQSDKIATRSPR